MWEAHARREMTVLAGFSWPSCQMWWVGTFFLIVMNAVVTWEELCWEERHCRPFSEHLVLSWCYPPCRVSTASDPAVCGAGSVTDSVVYVAYALDCQTPFAVGLQLLCCMLMWLCPLGVLDSGSRWHLWLWRARLHLCSLFYYNVKNVIFVLCFWLDKSLVAAT